MIGPHNYQQYEIGNIDDLNEKTQAMVGGLNGLIPVSVIKYYQHALPGQRHAISQAAKNIQRAVIGSSELSVVPIDRMTQHGRTIPPIENYFQDIATFQGEMNNAVKSDKPTPEFTDIVQDLHLRASHGDQALQNSPVYIAARNVLEFQTALAMYCAGTTNRPPRSPTLLDRAIGGDVSAEIDRTVNFLDKHIGNTAQQFEDRKKLMMAFASPRHKTRLTIGDGNNNQKNVTLHISDVFDEDDKTAFSFQGDLTKHDIKQAFSRFRGAITSIADSIVEASTGRLMEDQPEAKLFADPFADYIPRKERGNIVTSSSQLSSAPNADIADPQTNTSPNHDVIAYEPRSRGSRSR